MPAGDGFDCHRGYGGCRRGAGEVFGLVVYCLVFPEGLLSLVLIAHESNPSVVQLRKAKADQEQVLLDKEDAIEVSGKRQLEMHHVRLALKSSRLIEPNRLSYQKAASEACCVWSIAAWNWMHLLHCVCLYPPYI